MTYVIVCFVLVAILLIPFAWHCDILKVMFWEYDFTRPPI